MNTLGYSMRDVYPTLGADNRQKLINNTIDTIYNSSVNVNLIDSTLVDIDFSKISEGKWLNDNSGNSNIGILIDDYLVEYDEETLEPQKVGSSNPMNLSKNKKGKAY